MTGTEIIVLVASVMFLILLGTLSIVLSIRASRQHIKIMREGHAVEVEKGVYYAKLIIDGKVVDEIKSYGGMNSIKLSASVDDIDVKVQIGVGFIKPIFKVFINNEYVDDYDIIRK